MLSKERDGRITASMVGACLGVNPYCSRQEAWRLLTKRKKFEGNEMTQWGNDHEKDALMAYESLTGELVDFALDDQKFIIDHSFDWLGGTPDGRIDNILAEFKCPYSLKIPDEVPLHYIAQCQINMRLTETDRCHLTYWTPEKTKVFSFSWSLEYEEKALDILQEFRQYLLDDKEPKRKKKPNLPTIQTEVILND